MKMLKATMDENVWQKFYFVLVGKTIYYFGGADIAQMAEVGEPFISEMYALNTDTMQV